MTGKQVNFHKSAFQCSSNVPDLAKTNFATILGMNESDNLGDYLGCPIIDSRVTKETFWGNFFWENCKILTSSDKTYKNFFWDKDVLNKSANFIGWDKICLPK